MARQKISEFKAKTLLFKFLSLPYSGICVTEKNVSEKTKNLAHGAYVVKVDQGVKGRFKKGLVKLDVASEDMRSAVSQLSEKGYHNFLIEPYVVHEGKDEMYLSLSRTRDGILTMYSKSGGIEIEQDTSIKKVTVESAADTQLPTIAKELGIEERFLKGIFEAFDTYFFSFLEINPFIIYNTSFMILDLAIEVDSAAEFFVQDAWNFEDVIESNGTTPEEKNIRKLKEKSQASFKLNVLNHDGSVFVLLSGGGASLVVADEVYNLGYGKELANYGEYSGNPNEEETYIYTKNLLQLLLKSKSKKKVLIIGGGVANFTDVRITFRGVIQAIEEVKTELVQNNVKVFVRRGGPNQEEGLSLMSAFLKKNNLYGDVKGPEMVLTDIVREAVEGL